MVLKEGGRFRDRYGNAKPYYACPLHPFECRETHSAHPNGNPVGKPASPEVRELRQQAHRLAALLWGDMKSPEADLIGMYRWLKYNTKSGHIGMMEKAELLSLIQALGRKVKSGKLWAQRMV